MVAEAGQQLRGIADDGALPGMAEAIAFSGLRHRLVYSSTGSASAENAIGDGRSRGKHQIKRDHPTHQKRSHCCEKVN